MATENNWLRNNLRDRLEKPNLDLKVEVHPNPFVEMGFQEAANYTARRIYEHHKKLFLAFSGGADSDFVFHCLMRNGIPFTPILIKTSGNEKELSYAFRACKEYNVEPVVIEMTEAEMLTIFFNDVIKKINGCGIYSIPGMIACKYAKEHDGVLIIGEHLIEGEKPHKKNGKVYIRPAANEWDFYNECFVGDEYSIPFFNYTTELAYAMIKAIPETPMNIAEFKEKLYGTNYRPVFDYDFPESFHEIINRMHKTKTAQPDPNCELGTREEFLALLEPYKKPYTDNFFKDKVYGHLQTGYYLYNDRIYIDREMMLDDMLLEDKEGEVKFYFNDDVFSNINWEIEPEVSLKELYRERCQQLRDTYDYIILSYSGGADSHEILATFLEHNIFVDEIQIVTHYEAMKKINRQTLVSDPVLNMLLEFEYAALPQIKILKEKSPNTKITILDASQFMFDDIISRRFTFMGMHKSSVNTSFLKSTTPFIRNYYQQNYNNKTLKSKGKVCFLRGAEKPALIILRNQLFFNFTDVTMNTVKLMQLGQIDPIYDIENFFWSRSCPLIPVKQSHVLKKVLETDQSFYAAFMINQEKAWNHSHRAMTGHDAVQNFQRRYSDIIYYHWSKNMFVAPKHSADSPEFRLWRYINPEDTTPREALTEKNDYLNKKYAKIKDKKLVGKHLTSQMYRLGEIDAKWSY